MTSLVERSAEAVELRNKVCEQVYEFISKDPNHGMLGVYAVIKIGIDLVNNSDISDEAKLAIAHTLFFDLVHNTDIDGLSKEPANQNSP
ncbi:hypothetical protein [Kordiimonas lacus]|uniref:Uncharacterized protein n=1 Tax=Kordiimonas lacus TaxID=637679 RepID=A0A1G6XJZ9_9PROT|nr:hypothetical protein [Kordiimonas lacus]SDD78509.1 hypothetical protein SAMN04488071_1268 [Kordiimonas lacus]